MRSAASNVFSPSRRRGCPPTRGPLRNNRIPRRPVGSVPFDPVAGVVTDIARIDGRLDGFEKCLQRIEKRLELIEA